MLAQAAEMGTAYS